MDDLFKCDICKNNLHNDAQGLPCGKTICQDCVLRKFNDKFDCMLCKNKHSKSGLRVNELLNNLIMANKQNKFNIEPRSESKVIFNSFLNRIKFKTKEFVQKMSSPVDVVKYHCDEVRNEVKIAEEDMIESIRNEFSEFRSQINKYEKECLKNLDDKKGNIKNDLDKIKNESDEFVSKWENCLDNLSCEDIDSISIQKNAQELIANLSSKENDFKSLIFDKKLLKFSSKNHINKSRCFIYFDDKFNSSNLNEQFKIDEFGNMKLSDKLKDYSWNSIAQDSNSAKQTFVLMKFKIFWFNYTEFQLTKINIDENNIINLNFKSPYGLLMNSAHHPYIDINSSNIYLTADCKDNSSIFVFDQNLNFKNSGKFNHRISLSAFNKTRIFCMDNSKIYIYNMNFFQLSIVGQEFHQNDQFYLKNIRNIKASNEFLFLMNDKNQISVVNINDGKIHSKFEINSNEFLVYMDFCILNYNHESISLYTFDGEKYEFKIKPDHMMPSLGLIGYNQSGLSFLKWGTNELLVCDTPKDLIKFSS
jgi:hypothetical protein